VYFIVSLEHPESYMQKNRSKVCIISVDDLIISSSNLIVFCILNLLPKIDILIYVNVNLSVVKILECQISAVVCPKTPVLKKSTNTKWRGFLLKEKYNKLTTGPNAFCLALSDNPKTICRRTSLRPKNPWEGFG